MGEFEGCIDMIEDNKSTENMSKESKFNRVKVGLRLREARKYINLSQHVVAHHVGIPGTTLSQIESGQRRIEALELKKIAELYKLPVSYFTGEIPTMAGNAIDIDNLARAVANLSVHNRAEISRFADYLHARAHALRLIGD